MKRALRIAGGMDDGSADNRLHALDHGQADQRGNQTVGHRHTRITNRPKSCPPPMLVIAITNQEAARRITNILKG